MGHKHLTVDVMVELERIIACALRKGPGDFDHIYATVKRIQRAMAMPGPTQ